jgi:hypothetical protein
MKKSIFYLAAIALIGMSPGANAQQKTQTPSWAKELIVYEIATRGFTSPDGAESGTFRSTQAKLPYLHQLGITGIWLTGTNLANATHFYNIWTQYACVDPSKLDPVLGSDDDFRALIDEAHKLGIRVFMDVITHGVMNDSPLIREHPDWFKGGSWGMTDYDWNARNKELDDWWVETFTDWVVKYGIDGYRLDCNTSRGDLWVRIKENAAGAGHPIVVFNEAYSYSGGACDFLQRMATLSDQRKDADLRVALHTDVAEHFKHFDHFRVVQATVTYADGSIEYGYGDVLPFLDAAVYGYDPVPQGKLKLTVLNTPGYSTPEKPEYQRVRIEGIDPRKIVEKVDFMTLGTGLRPNYGKKSALLTGLTGSSQYEFSVAVASDQLLYSTQLSSHDDGWEGFPSDRNPYVAEGSRAMFGYSFLFTPTIPVFMSGEEFNADYVPLPAHTPDLYGKGKRGKGTWLYASMLDWQQLKQKAKQQMLKDVTRMIAIRKANIQLFAPVTTDSKPQIKALSLQVKEAVADETGRQIPVPYMLYSDSQAIVICGNPTSKTVAGVVNVSLKGTPLANAEYIYVTDLWNGGKAKRIKAGDLEHLPVSMKPDKTPQGGLAVLKIEAISPN